MTSDEILGLVKPFVVNIEEIALIKKKELRLRKPHVYCEIKGLAPMLDDSL